MTTCEESRLCSNIGRLNQHLPPCRGPEPRASWMKLYPKCPASGIPCYYRGYLEMPRLLYRLSHSHYPGDFLFSHRDWYDGRDGDQDFLDDCMAQHLWERRDPDSCLEDYS